MALEKQTRSLAGTFDDLNTNFVKINQSMSGELAPRTHSAGTLRVVLRIFLVACVCDMCVSVTSTLSQNPAASAAVLDNWREVGKLMALPPDCSDLLQVRTGAPRAPTLLPIFPLGG